MVRLSLLGQDQTGLSVLECHSVRLIKVDNQKEVDNSLLRGKRDSKSFDI